MQRCPHPPHPPLPSSPFRPPLLPYHPSSRIPPSPSPISFPPPPTLRTLYTPCRVPMRKRKRPSGGGGGGGGGGGRGGDGSRRSRHRDRNRHHGVRRRSHFDSSSESSDDGGRPGFADHDTGFDRYQRKVCSVVVVLFMVVVLCDCGVV